MATDNGTSPQEEVAVEIPLTVVPHNTKVSKAYFPYHHVGIGEVIALIVLSPVLVAAFVIVLPVMIVCGIGGDIGCG